MHLIFLSALNLDVLGHAYLGNEYEINLDVLVPQQSSFTINAAELRAEVGDYLVCRDTPEVYIGIIATIDELAGGNYTITTYDFLAKFDVEVPITSFSGNIAAFLLNLITTHFKASNDPKQNMLYLQTEAMLTRSGSFTYEADKKVNILDLLREFAKTYNIRLTYDLVLSDGKITNIKLQAVETVRGLTLKSNLSSITNLVVTDSNKDVVNKVIFVPKTTNVTYKTIQTYYLYQDGSIGVNANTTNRYERVRFVTEFFSDSDYPGLLSKATSLLVGGSLDHFISFDFAFIGNELNDLVNLTPGTFVRFIHAGKGYDTMVSKISYKGSFKVATIVLGEHRVSLTDKLKLLQRRDSK